MLHLRYVAHSEIGLVRKNNQDSGYASPTMLVVADGMGGAAAGDLASAVAITELAAADRSWDREGGMLGLMESTVTRANEHLAELVVADHDLDGMGTTVCGGLFDGERMGIAHIGDSRGYLLRDGQLHRLTSDHSWVQAMVDEGRINEEEALYHPHRSLLLKVLNGHPSNTPDLFHVRLQDGDRVMFCSDGLCGLADDTAIGEALSLPDRDEALRALVAVAHAGGGLDNITIVLADVSPEAPEPPLSPLVLGAAADVEIPEIHETKFELADEDPAEDVVTDAAGNPKPLAPPPVSPPTPTEGDEPAAPTGATAVDEDARYAPRQAPRRRWLWVLVPLLLLGLVGGVATLMTQNYLGSRYFVGVRGDRVAIFRGVPGQLGPFDLATLQEVSDVEVTNLPPRFAEDVRSNSYRDDSLAGIRVTIDNLRKRAEGCIEARRVRAQATTPPPPTTTAPPTPSGTPATPASSTPAESGSPSPGTTASVTATPTPLAPTTMPTPAPASENC